MNKKKVIIGIVTVAVAGGALFFLSHTSSKGGVELETAKVSRTSMTNVVTATGTVEPVTEVEVGTQVSGIINRIYVDYNSVVTKGQLIAEMDKVTLEAELRAQEAQLSNAKAEYEYQQKNYARSKVLFEKKLISDTDYETATYNYEKAEAAYNQAQASMVKVRQNLGYATITSPIDGVVISKEVEEGQTVAAGFNTPTLFTIANDLTQMRVIADVDEADIGQVEEGQHVQFNVDAYPNDVFEGNVTQMRLQATTESNVVTYEVVISAYNPDLKLKPGLTANVTIYTLQRNNVLCIPTKALRFVPEEEILAPMGYSVEDAGKEAPSGKRIVWQVKGKQLVPKEVTVGISSGNQTEITAGLSDGEEIVVEWAAVLPARRAGGETVEKSPFMPGPPGSQKKSTK